MKKVLPSLILLLAFLVLPAADMTYDSLPVKVVLFPFREAILSTQIDGVVVKYNFRGGERTEYSVDSGACKFDIPDDSPLTEEMRAELADIQASINSGDITIENKMLHK